jgi:hypothetical protein
MWNSSGRSGHHMQYVGNSYDEWEGISPNGRQVKNQLTNEVRNLSGAEYWHMRKVPIIEAKAPRKLKGKRSAFESIALADSLYSRLEKQLEALENEFNDGLLSWDDFQYAHRLQTERMAKAWKRVEKARNWDKQEESLTEHPEQAINIKRNTDSLGILDSISDDNCFKQAYILFRSIRVKLGKILLIVSEDSRGE